MEIKVKYQGQVVGLIDFKVFTAIVNFRKLGYGSFSVRSEVNKYEHFASFLDENSDDYIRLYPDKKFIKRNDYKVTYEELETIKQVLDYCIYIRNVEESE